MRPEQQAAAERWRQHKADDGESPYWVNHGHYSATDSEQMEADVRLLADAFTEIVEPPEVACQNCGKEFIVMCNFNPHDDEIEFCPFCGAEWGVDDEELDDDDE